MDLHILHAAAAPAIIFFSFFYLAIRLAARSQTLVM